MKPVTLQDIKERPINLIVSSLLKRTDCFSAWNIRAKRMRMFSGNFESCTRDITHDGNEPNDNETILDIARCYYEKHVYTDKEWEKYLLPAINEQIAANDSFVRWLPGYVIKSKIWGTCCIVEYDFAMGFGGRNFTS